MPVDVKGKFDQRIRDTQVANHGWSGTHWQTLRHAYGKAPFFRMYEDAVATAFEDLRMELSLSRINYRLIMLACELLGIHTPITWSMDYPQREGKSERLLSICQATGADHYLSGPAAKDYMDVELFESRGVRVTFADYSGYPEYPQPHGQFEHAVTVLDLLFQVGPDALDYMKLQP